MDYSQRPYRNRQGRPLRSVSGDQNRERLNALLAQKAPRVPWDEFNRRYFEWKQSEHVGLIGPNGQGKTTLLIALLKSRDYVIVLATKPRDRTLDELMVQGKYDLYHEWLDVPPDRSPRRIIWPDASDIDSDANQRKVFETTFKAVYKQGNWCLVVDEGYYIASELKLSKEMRKMWTQSRSLDVTFVVATQRPAWVPVEMYGESHHLFLWRTGEPEALRRISGLGVADSEAVRIIIQELEWHQCLYVNTRTGVMCRTRAPVTHTIDESDDEVKGGETA